MIEPLYYKSELEIEAKLAQFGITLDDALHIIRAVVTAHNDAVRFDPKTAAGQFRYIYGTRTMREVFSQAGWEVDRDRGIESAFEPNLGMKVVYQSVDRACVDDRPPKAVSDKGVASKSLIERSASHYLFPEMEEESEAHFSSARAKESATT